MAFTYFFRDLQTLRLVEQHAIPEIKTRKYINVWDAGSAMGPEPYSLAIIFRENMGPFLFRNLKIYATDINDQFGSIIENGVYPEESVKRIPQNVLNKYFTPADNTGHFKIDGEITRCVSFQKHDLLSLKPIREGFSLILCKNVLLHFKEEERVNVIRMFHSSLSEGGFFATEQTQKMPQKTAHLFRPVTTCGQLFKKLS